MMRDREFGDSEGMRPCDAGYGHPQPRQMDPKKGRRIKRLIRMAHSRVNSRQRSRRGLGRREYR